MKVFFRKYTLLLCHILFIIPAIAQQANKIDRKALVQRHNVVVTSTDSLSALSLGNGRFAFTVDATGLQSFPEHYDKGIPLGTQSQWGWHSFRDTVGYKFEETLKKYDFNGQPGTYAVQWHSPERNKEAADWFRENVHRLQLGGLGFEIIKKDGSIAAIQDIKDIHQTLNLWTGEISSHFTIDGEAVDVKTDVHQGMDMVAVDVRSALLKKGRLKVIFRFPYPTNEFADYGDNWKNPEKHSSGIVKATNSSALIYHRLDTTRYFVKFGWKGTASFRNTAVHQFLLTPGSGIDHFQFSCLYSAKKTLPVLPDFNAAQANNKKQWAKFWGDGGAVDFTGSTDPRANELERRIVLSQYLLRIQEAGSYPPQETGLTYNSWYGKPHLEMHYWHSLQFALWGRPELLERSMTWYFHVKHKAEEIAKRQGFDGARWQKMTDPDGNESPSSVGAFLIWQEPHLITFAEAVYRIHHNRSTLNRYKDLVFATADFMASFPFYDKVHNRYVLGKGVIAAQERYNPEQTYNPTYELQYWYWALTTAQQWRKRLGLPLNKKYAAVLKKLSALPQKDGVYLSTESSPDCYSNPRLESDHPSVLAAYGMLPYNFRLDTAVMKKTFNLIWNTWNWKDTWGWDFPMTAMAATRLGLPDKAIDALFMPIQTNTYLPNGHNYQDARLRIYLPGNGGLLTAVALMCAGWDGCKTSNPGFPKNGKWKVRWEGLQRMF
ncbi:MAG: hypothetical protein ACTHNW_14860 [Mucilaginibacter sp.]